ncbi:DNA cytosine methyltransferase [Escherichia coli]|nr:DNA cytosine methyltransferase [Escherichia coli]
MIWQPEFTDKTLSRKPGAVQVLDAQYFGVAQARRRVFVVASAGKRLDPGKVLFEFPPVSQGDKNYYGKKKKSESLLDQGIEVSRTVQ